MPLLEHLPVKVTLTVEVDGHTLTFEETGEVDGGRYNGADPRQRGYWISDTLELGIRDTVHTLTARVAKRSEAFLRNAYPACGDNHAGRPPADGDDVDLGSLPEYRSEESSPEYRGRGFLGGTEVPGER